MAITQDYVAYATGNDYKGATFTDGAYTSATKTLVKNAAFAASKVNHWLYLESNDGGSIVAGYYKIATWTDASTVILATDAGAGVDDDAAKCTQAAGTALLPWRSLQGAFDLCTRGASDGNQVNLKAGTAQVNAVALDLTVFVVGGALSYAAPLVIRGYTAAANDGGIGEIDCGGATMFTATSYNYIALIDLEIHTFGDSNGVVCNGCMYNCEVHKGASSPSGKSLVKTVPTWGCYIHGTGAGNAIGLDTTVLAVGNYVVLDSGAGNDIGISGTAYCLDNIVVCKTTTSKGISGGSQNKGNICYNTAAGTNNGLAPSNSSGSLCMNNIVVGFSGAGGEGIQIANIGAVGYNAFYNNTGQYTVIDQKFLDLTAHDVTLAADPFTDAANGDFSLTAAGKAALRSLGFPLLYYGAHANTDPHITIGPMQYGPAPDLTVITEAGGGTYHEAAAAEVIDTVNFGAASALVGTVHLPLVAEVIDTATFGVASALTGTIHQASANEVIDTATFGPASAITGTIHQPEAAEVIDTAVFGAASAVAGTVHQPAVGEVIDTATFGPGSAVAGTFAIPAVADVEDGVLYGAGGVEFEGTLVVGGGGGMLKAEKRGGKQ
jgi:hypothetical protein